MKPIRLAGGIFTVGAWTLASRVLGLVRDAMMLALLGVGPAYEAFVVAFRLPNMFRRFFAEGAFNTAFVPMFARRLEGGAGHEGEARAFAEDALAWLTTVLVVVTVAGQIAMPWLVWLLASGFVGTEKAELTVLFGRICFPYILFISIAALFSGVLNATGRFAAAAAAPVLLNVLLVAAMGTAAFLGANVGLTLAWAVPTAGILQAALVWWAAARAGFPLRLRLPPRPSPRMRRLVVVATPAALAGGVLQINLLVGQQVASWFDGAVGWLYAADRLYQLPLGVVGIAVGIVLLPDLARRLKAGDEAGARHAFSRAGEIALALTLPAAVALLVVPLPVVSVLYERGQATSDDTAAIALAVMIYAAGLPAFVLQKLLQPLYFAREDTARPFRYAVASMVVNALAAVGLVPLVGWTAPAFATTLAAWAMVLLLHMGARSMGPTARFDARFRRRLWRILLASVVMGAALWALQLALGVLLALPGWRILGLAALVAAGAVIYFAVAELLGAISLREVRAALSRRPTPAGSRES